MPHSAPVGTWPALSSSVAPLSPPSVWDCHITGRTHLHVKARTWPGLCILGIIGTVKCLNISAIRSQQVFVCGPGYGNISPKTTWGQFFCIWYTLVGIPLFGFLLGAAGDHLGTSLRNAIAKVEALLWVNDDEYKHNLTGQLLTFKEKEFTE